MTYKAYLNATPQEIAQACSDLKSKGFGVAKRLKGKNSVGGRYLRYAPEGFIDLLKANLYWDTRYLGAVIQVVVGRWWFLRAKLS